MNLSFNLDLSQMFIMILPLMVGVVLHEVAHGWVAEKLGDPTARLMGRISLNPLVHVDIFGTLILPLLLFLVNSPFLFGWAKPVPVRMELLRGGRLGMAKVAIAGPLTNLMLAALGSCVYHGLLWMLRGGILSPNQATLWFVKPLLMMAGAAVTINLALMLINLIPVPPLDGGRFVMGIVPESLAIWMAKVERYGMLIILILIVTDLWSIVMSPILRRMVRFFLW
ncbi:MAG: site-2 protease family protein [Syntrophobacterales bacterium]|nr:site-2 protease family protein [Syntrophobacterales bacterium]